MDWTRVTVVSTPGSPPITRDEAKEHLRVTTNDDNAYIDGLIDAAVGVIDGPDGIGVALKSQTWRLRLDWFPIGYSGSYVDRSICLPGWPVTSVTSVKYFDGEDVEQTMDAADYRTVLDAEPARIEAKASWPTIKRRIGAVSVDYVVGDAPGKAADSLRQAVLMMVGHWYENREEVTLEGRPMVVPMGAEYILRRYRRGVA